MLAMRWHDAEFGFGGRAEIVNVGLVDFVVLFGGFHGKQGVLVGAQAMTDPIAG